MADLQERFQTNDMFSINLIIPINDVKYISNCHLYSFSMH